MHSWRGMQGTYDSAERVEFSRKYLRFQAAGSWSGSCLLSAVGSFKEEHKPTDFVIPDQFVDRTTQRVSTIFRGRHGRPRRVRRSSMRRSGGDTTRRMQVGGGGGKWAGLTSAWKGRSFRPKRSRTYTAVGVGRDRHDQLQEAKLAREAEICYVTVAMVTDYDCWHPQHEAVTVDQIVDVLGRMRRTLQRGARSCEIARCRRRDANAVRCCACHSNGSERRFRRDEREIKTDSGQVV